MPASKSMEGGKQNWAKLHKSHAKVELTGGVPTPLMPRVYGSHSPAIFHARCLRRRRI